MPFSITHSRRIFLTAVTHFAAAGAAHAASPGCNAVNAGAWNVSLQSFATGATLSGFDNGDKLHFRVSVNGQLALLGSFGGDFITVLVVNTPGSGNFTVSPSYSTFRILNDAVAGPLSVTATCTPANTGRRVLPADELSQTAVRGFLASRSNALLLADPSNISLLRRDATGANAQNDVNANPAGPPGFAGLGASGLHGEADAASMAQPLAFRTSISEIARAYAARGAMQLGHAPATPAGYVTAFDVWVEGRYSGYDDDTAGLDREGHVGVVYVGADYRLTRDLITGALVEIDRTRDSSNLLETRAQGTGWMAGPYLSAHLLDSVYLDLRAAWGTSANEIAADLASASFGTTRWLVKGAVAGNWLHDRWRLTPMAEIAYVAESQDAFLNAAGLVVAGDSVALGRVQFGPELGYGVAHRGALIEPFAALRGVWNFDAPDVPTVDGFVVGPGSFWGRLEGGLTVAARDGWSMRGSGSWDGIGSADYSGYTFEGTVSVPLN